MANYRLISSDSHVYEPADLWDRYIDPEFQERAPQLVHELDTDQWYADGGRFMFGEIGQSIQFGTRFENPDELSMKGRYSDAPLGGFDPHTHVKDMDLDGVAGGVLYPSMGLTAYGIPPSDLLSAMFRAYNDWLSDFCHPYPKRLKGIAMINIDDVDDGIRELQRSAKLGLTGEMIPMVPLEKRYDDPVYEPFWAAAQDLQMPLSLHLGTLRSSAAVSNDEIKNDPVMQVSIEAPLKVSLSAMIFGGVFERYPKLMVGVVEFELSWIPFFLRNMDHIYNQRTAGIQGRRFKNDMLPSDFFRQNTFVSFQEDDLGIKIRDYIGVHGLMWGSDYPHQEGTYPKSREIVDRILQDVSEQEKIMITGENASRLYGFE